MLLLKVVVFSLFLRFSFSQANYSYASTPSRIQGQDAVYIIATVGQSLSISCNITNNQTGDIVPPVWSLSINGSQFDLSFNETNGLSDDPSLSLMVSNDNTNLTLLSFTEDYNRATFSCGPMPGIELERFVIGILNPPTLIGDVSTVNVTEGENETITLVSQSSDPFPPFYTLSYNGDVSNFILTNTSLSIINAQRNMSGNYTFFLNHVSGNLSVTFSLNVQYAPSGSIPVDTTAYGRIGDNITLTLFNNLSGNPFPRVEWYFNGSILSDASKYDMTHPLQLIIRNVDIDDFGSYIGYAINIAGNISSVITLTKAVQPGAPLSLQESNVTHNSVYIEWVEPPDTGLPQLSGYVVEINPPVQGSPFVTADTNTSISINGLFPTIQYSVSVAAVSSAYPEGGNETSLSFTTTDGPPEFSTTAITPLPNGNISIALKLRHVGGVGYEVLIDAFCSTDMDYELGSGSGDPNMNDANTFTYSCEERCFDVGLSTSFSLGPITAGMQYYCSVNAYNLVGSATLRQNLVPVIGKPSRPVVAVSTSPGLIRVYLLCQYAGIVGGSSLSFNVTVETDQGSEVYNQTYQYTDYTNNTNRSVSIPVNGGMTYYAEVFAINEHGYSELTRLGPFNVTVNVTEAPTEEESTRLLIIIIGASVGGLIVAVVFISIIICICGCCCKKRKSRTVQFHTSSTQTWKRGDVRAMEMSQRHRR